MLSCLGDPLWKYTRRYAPVTTVVYWLVFSFLYSQVDAFNGGSLSSTLEMFQASACDGSHVRIQCPPRTLISIQYASYGRSRPSSDMACPSDKDALVTTQRPSFRDLLSGRRRRREDDNEGIEMEYGGRRISRENTDCVAVRSFEVMSELCERRPSCAVLASPDTFKEDPCVSTSKYIDVYYKCRPDAFRTDTACEGEEMDIRCGRGDRMVISAAMFGRVPNGSEICPTAKAAYIRCELSDFVDAVRDQCHKRRKCQLEANETDWGKPCSDDISTYLTVTYACLPKKYVKDLNPRGGRRKKKRRKKKRRKKKGKGKGKGKGKPATTTITVVDLPSGSRETLGPGSSLEELTTESSSELLTTQNQYGGESTEQEAYEPEEEVVTLTPSDGFEGSESSSENPPYRLANLTEALPDVTTVQDSPEHVDSTEGSNPGLTTSPDETLTTPKEQAGFQDHETSTEFQDEDVSTESSPDMFEELTTYSNEDITDQTSTETSAETTDDSPHTTTSDNRPPETNEITPVKSSEKDDLLIRYRGSDDGDNDDDDDDVDDDDDDDNDTEEKNLVRGVKEDTVGANPIEDGTGTSWDVSTDSSLKTDSHKNWKDVNPKFSKPVSNPDQFPKPEGAKEDVEEKEVDEEDEAEEGKDNTEKEDEEGEKEKPPVLVTERDLKVLCSNYTKTDVRWYEIPRPRDERSIGFLKDWFSVWHFLSEHEEKAWLYFTLGICGGIIILLIIILIKVCINFRRNIKARLDVSEPTHRNAHTNNHHSSLETPMLEHSDSIDRIEVVRFSPRSTLRSIRSSSHNRDIVNYYG